VAAALRSEFVFALCQLGAERALKADLTRAHPELRAAYQRPGLVTFRRHGPALQPSELRLRTPLARAFGLSLGTYPDLEALAGALATLELAQPVCLQVSEREQLRERAPGEPAAGEQAKQVDLALRARFASSVRAGRRATSGELVVDVVVGEPGEPMLLGAHVHGDDREQSPDPGGLYDYELPDEAPSRAYRKIEEAIRAFALPVQPGHVALELGAAPGGAAYALLRRGVHVVGVDPAQMDPRVLAFEGPGGARLRHVQLSMAAVELATLPRQVDWLLLDVHLAPQVALRHVSRFAAHYRRSLRGAVLTLKLNDWAFLEELPRFEARACELGLVAPRARQLPAHRQELAIAGLTKLAMRELPR
jgi:23S rRNA (cytidine2498-2'-O)-methyltransferase